MHFQRTIQDLFEVEAGSGEKVEEFVVLHQEPSGSEAISPRVALPYIQALHSINLDPPEEEQQEEELAGDEELEGQDKEEPAHKGELDAVMEQVALFRMHSLETRGTKVLLSKYLNVFNLITAHTNREVCSAISGISAHQ